MTTIHKKYMLVGSQYVLRDCRPKTSYASETRAALQNPNCDNDKCKDLAVLMFSGNASV